MPESHHRDSADIGPGGILDIGIIFASTFPDDLNVESRLKLTGPFGVICEAGHHILKEDVPIWKRWGDALLEKNQQDQPVEPHPILTCYAKQAV